MYFLGLCKSPTTSAPERPDSGVAMTISPRSACEGEPPGGGIFRSGKLQKQNLHALMINKTKPMSTSTIKMDGLFTFLKKIQLFVYIFLKRTAVTKCKMYCCAAHWY